ncbi:hypothetical protein JHK86_007496 [Glycine max]|nr:hypothetical protein JHK86_007496 [Glycine max]
MNFTYEKQFNPLEVKKAIKRVRCRLRLLKNKRQAIARQLRNDLVELIQSGHEETAFNQV